jgi:putative copper resistance protein D
MVLAGGLVAVSIRALPASRLFDVVLAVLAMVYCGGLAWAGHASGTPGFIGSIHRAADVLHLLAASAWIGGLVPLALLLAGARHASDLTFAAEATQRFSTLGLIAVGTVLLTGALNAYILVGSIPALTDTEYGRLLSVKIGVFVVMVFIAAINRLRLAPGLTSLRNGAISARQLQRNSLIEAALGLAIVGIVGALGALPPGAHVHAM